MDNAYQSIDEAFAQDTWLQDSEPIFGCDRDGTENWSDGAISFFPPLDPLLNTSNVPEVQLSDVADYNWNPWFATASPDASTEPKGAISLPQNFQDNFDGDPWTSMLHSETLDSIGAAPFIPNNWPTDLGGGDVGDISRAVPGVAMNDGNSDNDKSGNFNRLNVSDGSEQCDISESSSSLPQTHDGTVFHCAECNEAYASQFRLDEHASQEGHLAYVCEYPDCSVECIRIADLRRHQVTHKNDVPRHPCPHCRTYRGNNGFKRKDHLRQHITGYHRIDVSSERSQKRPGSRDIFGCRDNACIFQYPPPELRTLDQLAAHMLNDHGSSAYVCKRSPCMRIGMIGFDNDKELKAHVKTDHVSPFQCSQPGCPRVGNKGWTREIDMVKHIKKEHSIAQPSLLPENN